MPVLVSRKFIVLQGDTKLLTIWKAAKSTQTALTGPQEGQFFPSPVKIGYTGKRKADSANEN
jgi:hypothetical protein